MWECGGGGVGIFRFEMVVLGIERARVGGEGRVIGSSGGSGSEVRRHVGGFEIARAVGARLCNIGVVGMSGWFVEVRGMVIF